jgi:amidohydrolase
MRGSNREGRTMLESTRANDPAPEIRTTAERIAPHLVQIRRDIHAHPELAFEEVRTASRVADELTRLGIAHRTGVGRTGVVGLIEGGRPGPVLAIRADMDALPIAEQTGLAFASKVPGLMHACGHDIHTSTLIGVAAVLKQFAPQISGSIKLVFQPAEEALGGAAAMLKDGLLEEPKVDLALGFHNHPDIPVGRFGYCRGACLAASDRFEVTVEGRSGHAAHPETAIDPIIAAAHLITQLQTVVSREVDPIQPVVVTVGAIHGGTANNIIPDKVAFRGTVRTLHAESRRIAEAAIGRFCEGALATLRVRCALEYAHGVPALVNDDGVLDRTVGAVRAQFGNVIESGPPSLGGEDFALIAERVPAFQLRIGSGQRGRNDKLHNSAYQPDEACIALGVQALARTAMELLA